MPKGRFGRRSRMEFSMAVEITHVRFGGTTRTESAITNFKWKAADGSTGQNTKAELVDWIDNKNGRAHVGTDASKVEVGVVHPDTGAAYLRTYADGKWTNNLVNLPTF